MCGILEDDYKTTTLHITKVVIYYKVVGDRGLEPLTFTTSM